MFTDQITDYFEGVAAKYLSAVDADPTRSNGHEIGGLPAAGAKVWLGTPVKGQVLRYRAQHVYISDEQDEPLICSSEVSWYDARSKQPQRSAEYRLYYEDTAVTQCFHPGDFCLLAKHCDGRLLMVFAPPYSTAEKQLRAIFGLDTVGENFQAGNLSASHLLLPLRLFLESLGFELNKLANDDGAWLDRLIAEFGEQSLPSTERFSSYARQSLAQGVDPIGQPDQTLLVWMEQEEKLFRIYERHLVMQRLDAGFSADSQGVDAFISYSLSVQNRRKSRVGYAFEGHLRQLFQHHALQFQQGAKGLVTENNARPDFLFPSFHAYHNPLFPIESLVMLGAKTTCKDRWRQVLSEAQRIPNKHLITLEPSISETQTQEMHNSRLQLVIPQAIFPTFSAQQQAQLMTLSGFIALVKSKAQIDK